MADEGSSDQVNLREDVKALCIHWPRPVGTEAHRQARDYLARRLHDIGVAPYAGDTFELPYRDRFANLVGAVGDDSEAPPLLLGAHYDTLSRTPGADDNAAAVAIALEVARRLTAKPSARRVVVALFDAEEPPYFHSAYMGSNVFVRDQLAGCVATALAGHPFLFLTCGQWEHYHQPTDVPEVLDYGKMGGSPTWSRRSRVTWRPVARPVTRSRMTPRSSTTSAWPASSVSRPWPRWACVARQTFRRL